MRKKKSEEIFIVKANEVMIDGEEFTGDLNQLEEAKSFTVNFESGLDYFIFFFTGLIEKINQRPENDSLKKTQLEYLIQMRDFFSTRITSLKVYPSPDSAIPYKYDVAYKAVGDETKEQVEEKIKEYLRSEYFNNILGLVDPRIFDIMRLKEEARESDKELSFLKKALEKVKKEGKTRIKTKVKAGKHLIDNVLRTNFESQLPLFESLGKINQKQFLSEGTSIEMINTKGEGINLSKGEYKLLLCFLKILQDKSNTIAPEKGDYYLGDKIEKLNDSVEISTQEGKEIILKTPALSFTLYEITKEFVLEDNPGGNDIKAVAKILHSLAYDSDKKVLIRYTRKEILEKGRERVTKVETYSPLIRIFNFEQEDFLNGKKVDKAKEIIVSLHPVFIDQIEKIYIELPLPRDVMEAYGSSNVSELAFKLIFELSRALSNRKKLPKDEGGNYIYTIGVKKLQQKIAETYYKQSRYPLIKDLFRKATETAKSLGMLKDYREEVGATGELLYKFTLSKDY
jgi:hypothetical protein